MKFWTTNRTEGKREYTLEKHINGVELYIHSSCSGGIVIRTLKSQSHTVLSNWNKVHFTAGYFHASHKLHSCQHRTAHSI